MPRFLTASRLGIRWRLTVLILLLLGPIAGLIYLNVRAERTRMADEAAEDVRTQAFLIASAHDQLLETVEQLLAQLAHDPALLDFTSEECNDVARRLTAAHPAYSNIAVSGLEGIVECSANPQGVGSLVADRPYYQQALATGEITTSGYLFGRISQKPVDVFAIPLVDTEGETAGVVELSIDVQWLQRLIESVDAGSVQTTVVGPDGLVIARVPAGETGDLDPGWVEEVLSADEPTMRELREGERPTALTAIVPLQAIGDLTPGYVVVATPRAAALAAADETFRRGLTTLGMIALTGLVGAWAISTLGVYRPVRALVETAREYARGRFQTRVGISSMSSGEMTELAGAFESMADTIAENQAELQRNAVTDLLTGLPNRNEMRRLVDERFAEDPGREHVGLMLQLHDFGGVNAMLGFDSGDALLRLIAARLVDVLGPAGIVARNSGDEFMALVPSGDPQEVAGTLYRVFDEPFMLDGQPIYVNFRAGLARYPRDGTRPRQLAERASLALRETRAGREIVEYDAARDEPRAEQLKTLAALRSAEGAGELELFYQPKVDLQSGDVRGAEALMRWRRGGTYVPPSEFIPLAEQTGYIRTLTAWALNSAAAQARLWLDQGLHLEVGINLSAADFDDDALPVRLRDLLAQWNLPAGAIDIEITESSVMSDPDEAVRVCETLREIGYAIAIDDFGTGYSPLVYLKRLPVTSIKIDQAFVRDVVDDERSRHIVEATVQLAHRFGLRTVAEGVETAETVTVLRALGCDIGQGYYFGRPMAAADFTAWLRARAADATPAG